MAATKMTEGNIHRQLLLYSVPLILGNLFQLTYNALDAMIVGRFIGKAALAAVGTAGPVMSILILGISGICVGASVLMSEFFGAGNEEQLKRELSATAVLGLGFSLPVLLIGWLLAPALLQSLQVPAALLGLATRYLRVIFLGLPFTFFYNALAAAMKSVGDSKTPLRFLAFASVLNGCLDYLSIGVFHGGIVWAAITTVIAEGLSALLCLVYVYRHVPLLRLRPREFRPDMSLMRRTLQYGSVTALQQACQPIGKLLIQGAVNGLGVDAIASFNAVNRFDDYACLPTQSISQGMTTFIAQNRGAGKWARIHRGFWTGIRLELCFWVLVCLCCWFLRTPFMRLFVDERNEQVIALGSSYLAWMALFYIFPGFTNAFQGFFRGMGMMSVTLTGTLIQISFRVIFVYLLLPRYGMDGAAFACAVGWTLMLLFEVPYFFVTLRRRVPKSAPVS